MADPFVFPYADADDVQPLYQQMRGQTVTFGDATNPTLPQVVAHIRNAASYVVMRLMGTGYSYPLAPIDPATTIDEPTKGFITFLVAMIAAAQAQGLHIPGEKGPRFNGLWSMAFKFLDEIEDGSAKLSLAFTYGTTAAAVNSVVGVPYIVDTASEDLSTMTEYAAVLLQRRAKAGFYGYTG